jgi:hypothetical protein
MWLASVWISIAPLHRAEAVDHVCERINEGLLETGGLARM